MYPTREFTEQYDEAVGRVVKGRNRLAATKAAAKLAKLELEMALEDLLQLRSGPSGERLRQGSLLGDDGGEEGEEG